MAQRTTLLIIDPQIDFHPGGSLAVAGSDDDARRIAGMIEEKGLEIERIVVTMDTHAPTHIAHGCMWKDPKNDAISPDPFTLISSADIRADKWTARDNEKRDLYLQYCEGLEAKGRFQLCIWPEHCVKGTAGHAVYPIIFEALKHWQAGGKSVSFIEKGQNENTEMYSALAAEFPVEEDPRTQFNEEAVKQLGEADRVIVCGQAMSHCVNFTVRDILGYWKEHGIDASKMVLLSDGASAVTGFEQSAAEFVDYCKSCGVRVLKTQELLDSWNESN